MIWVRAFVNYPKRLKSSRQMAMAKGTSVACTNNCLFLTAWDENVLRVPRRKKKQFHWAFCRVSLMTRRHYSVSTPSPFFFLCMWNVHYGTPSGRPWFERRHIAASPKHRGLCHTHVRAQSCTYCVHINNVAPNELQADLEAVHLYPAIVWLAAQWQAS